MQTAALRASKYSICRRNRHPHELHQLFTAITSSSRGQGSNTSNDGLRELSVQCCGSAKVRAVWPRTSVSSSVWVSKYHHGDDCEGDPCHAARAWPSQVVNGDLPRCGAIAFKPNHFSRLIFRRRTASAQLSRHSCRFFGFVPTAAAVFRSSRFQERIVAGLIADPGCRAFNYTRYLVALPARSLRVCDSQMHYRYVLKPAMMLSERYRWRCGYLQ